MKKFLIGTSALIGAAAISTSAHAAPEVTVGGFIDFQAGVADQDLDAGVRDYNFQNDSEIHVTVEGKSDSGLTYGAVIELESDVTADADGEGFNSDKTYIYLESNAGRVELGNNSGAQDTMKVDASSIARATGGIDGDWYDYVTVAPTGGGFIIRPDLPQAHGRGIAEDATKVTYYSPRFSGLQLGVSFTPDNGNGGTAAGFSGEYASGNENVWGLAAHYAGNVGGADLQLSVTGEFGDAEDLAAGVPAATEDLAAWAIGGSVSKDGFSVAASWMDWDDSGLAVGGGTESDAWTLGVAYETGPFGFSATYLDSEAADTMEFTNLSIGADYQLAPGLVPYVEVSFFEFDDNIVGTTDNEGTVFLVGTELTF